MMFRRSTPSSWATISGRSGPAANLGQLDEVPDDVPRLDLALDGDRAPICSTRCLTIERPMSGDGGSWCLLPPEL